MFFERSHENNDLFEQAPEKKKGLKSQNKLFSQSSLSLRKTIISKNIIQRSNTELK